MGGWSIFLAARIFSTLRVMVVNQISYSQLGWTRVWDVLTPDVENICQVHVFNGLGSDGGVE